MSGLFNLLDLSKARVGRKRDEDATTCSEDGFLGWLWDVSCCFSRKSQ